MTDREMDELIDAAASQMACVEPRRAVGVKVMGCVGGRRVQSHRVSAWTLAAVASVLLCAAIVWNVADRAPATPAVAVQTVTLSSAPLSPTTVGAPPQVVTRPPALPAFVEVSQVPLAAIAELPSAPAPLETQPIVVPGIELAALVEVPVPIERIEIADITIEPLTTSND